MACRIRHGITTNKISGNFEHNKMIIARLIGIPEREESRLISGGIAINRIPEWYLFKKMDTFKTKTGFQQLLAQSLLAEFES